MSSFFATSMPSASGDGESENCSSGQQQRKRQRRSSRTLCRRRGRCRPPLSPRLLRRTSALKLSASISRSFSATLYPLQMREETTTDDVDATRRATSPSCAQQPPDGDAPLRQHLAQRFADAEELCSRGGQAAKARARGGGTGCRGHRAHAQARLAAPRQQATKRNRTRGRRRSWSAPGVDLVGYECGVRAKSMRDARRWPITGGHLQRRAFRTRSRSDGAHPQRVRCGRSSRHSWLALPPRRRATRPSARASLRVRIG